MGNRIHVHLTDQDVQWCKDLGEKRSMPKEGYASTNRWTKGNKYHYYGILGEFAVARQYGVSVDETIDPCGDGGVDMVILGQTVDVKLVDHPDPILKLNRLSDFTTDLACMTRLIDENNIEICGFTDLKNFVKHCEAMDFGYGKKACLQEQHLYF